MVSGFVCGCVGENLRWRGRQKSIQYSLVACAGRPLMSPQQKWQTLFSEISSGAFSKETLRTILLTHPPLVPNDRL